MTTTEQNLTHADFTDEQRAEWRALSDRAQAEHEAMQKAQHDAGGWLVYALENPGSSKFARTEAQKAARETIKRHAEWRSLTEQTAATPYGAFLKAELEVALAKRRGARESE